MKIIFKLIAVLCCTVSINAQGNYEEGMKKALSFWEGKKIEDASNLFEQIAKTEKENWLPYYYIALMNVTEALSNTNKEDTPSQLKKAQENLDISKTLTSNNPENMVLQALLFIADLIQDPKIKSQNLAPKIEALYQKALTIAPKNPRVVAGFADWKYNSAKYLKQDTAPYCSALKKSLLLFEAKKPSVPFAPTWGKDRVQMLVNQCAK